MSRIKSLRSAIAIAASLMLAVGISAPAQAATHTASIDINSVTYTVDSPSQNAIAKAEETIKAEKLKDPSSFNRKVNLIRKSTATMNYVQSYSGVNVDLQVRALAASMPEDALTGFTGMLDAGVLTFTATKNSNGSFTVKVTVNTDSATTSENEQGKPVATPAAWPACPAAWAAFWAWLATEGTMCGALAGIPAAAVSCAIGFGLGGLIVDFNAGC